MTVGTTSLSRERRDGSLAAAVSVSPLFTDVVQCLGTPLLEIKKSVYLNT